MTEGRSGCSCNPASSHPITSCKTSLESRDLQASLGTYHLFKKALCQRSQSWIYRQSPRNRLRRGYIPSWLMGTQRASASPHRKLCHFLCSTQEGLIQNLSSPLVQSPWPVSSLPSNFSPIPTIDEVPHPKASSPCMVAWGKARGGVRNLTTVGSRGLWPSQRKVVGQTIREDAKAPGQGSHGCGEA